MVVGVGLDGTAEVAPIQYSCRGEKQAVGYPESGIQWRD